MLVRISHCIFTFLSLGEDGEEVLYGTQNGRVGLVHVGPKEPLYRWDLDNEKREGGEGRGVGQGEGRVGSVIGMKWSSKSGELNLHSSMFRRGIWVLYKL